jgi:hypothetical protein
MNKTSTTATVTRIPPCDFCTNSAVYDTKMRDRSSWAYMCEDHYAVLGIGRLGLGLGQRLILPADKADTPDTPDATSSRTEWTTAELREEFTVLGFSMGYVVVQRKADDVKGSMLFKRVNDADGEPHRVYYGWAEDKA